MVGDPVSVRLRDRHTMLFRPLWLYVCLIIGYSLLFGKDAEKTAFIVRYSSIAFGVLLIPQLVLHLKYFLDNAQYHYEASGDSLKVHRMGHGHTGFTITPENVTEVWLFASPSVVESRTRWFPWEEYYYWIIICKNGERLVINSLLIDDISSVLPTPATINHRRVKLFCWPPGEQPARAQ